MDWRTTRLGRLALRLSLAYWGRVLLMAPIICGTFLGLAQLDPAFAEPKYWLLLLAAMLIQAAKTARQMQIAVVPMFVYAGSRVRWVLEQPNAETWTLLIVSLVICAASVWLAWSYPSMGLSPLLGWIGVPDGRQLPVVFAPCGCKRRQLHWQVMAIGSEIEFDFGEDYTVNVPKGPPVLNYNLIMREADGRRFLRSLDTKC